MNSNIKINSIYVTIFQVFNLLIPLIIAPYAARVLGPIGLGEIAYAKAIYIYFQLLVGLGSGIYGQRLIARSKDDYKSISIAFLELWFLRVLLAITGILIFSIMIISSEFIITIKILLFVQIIDLSINLFDISWFYYGIQNFKKVIITQAAFKLITVLTIFLFVNNYDDGYKYLLCFSVPALLSYIFMWRNINSFISFKYFLKIKPFKHFKKIIFLFIPFIGVVLFSHVDRLLIGYITGDMAEVGIYEMAFKFIAIIVGIATAISAVLLSSIAEAHSRGDIEHVKNILQKAFDILIVIGLWLSISLYFTAPYMVPWFLGEGFINSINVLQVLSIIAVIKTLTILIGSGFLLAIGQEKKYAIAIWSSLALNVFLNIILIDQHKSIGAAYASLIAEALMLALLIYFSRDFFLKKVIKSMRSHLILSLSSIVIISKLFSLYVNNLFLAALVLIAVFIMYLVILTLVFKKAGTLLYFLNLIKSKSAND